MLVSLIFKDKVRIKKLNFKLKKDYFLYLVIDEQYPLIIQNRHSPTNKTSNKPSTEKLYDKFRGLF